MEASLWEEIVGVAQDCAGKGWELYKEKGKGRSHLDVSKEDKISQREKSQHTQKDMGYS